MAGTKAFASFLDLTRRIHPELPMDLTPAARRSLEIADKLGGIRPDWPAGIRLICSLLTEEEGAARRLLAGSGLNIETFLSDYHWPEEMEASQFSEDGPGQQLLPTWGRLLRQARWISKELGDPGEITSEHLIASLLLDPDSLDQAVHSQDPLHPSVSLTRHGLDIQHLARTIRPGGTRVIPLDEPLFESPGPANDKPAPSTPGISLERPMAGDWEPGLIRLIDACANRAREGLRVVEDHARFFLNHPALTRGLKELRHDFQQAMETLPAPIRTQFLTVRDVRGDVGTVISTPTEMTRKSPASVAIANFKRVQETLRSLEEYCKCFPAPTAGLLESLRYRSYKLEQLLNGPVPTSDRLQRANLYLLVTAEGCALGFEKTTRLALEGGVDIIQSREKGISDKDWLDRLHLLRQWTREAGALLVVNDRPDLAILCDADGVHTGQDDLPVEACRSIFRKAGSPALVGYSTHSVAQFQDALNQGADYAGVGPVFPSQTKQFENFPGLELVQGVRGIQDIPWFALGGISLENLDLVIAAGAKRVAVSHCLLQSDRPDQIARAFKNRLGS